MNSRIVVSGFVAAAILAVYVPVAGFGQTAPAPPQLSIFSNSPQSADPRIQKRDQLRQQATAAAAVNRFDEAIRHAAKALTIDREVLGANNPDLVAGLDILATLREQQGQVAEAAKLRQESLELIKLRYNQDHWRVVDARLALAYCEVLAKLSDEQRLMLLDAARQLQQVGQQQQDPPRATALIEAALATRTQLLGAEHRLTGEARLALGVSWLIRSKDADRALPELERAERTLHAALGEVHPEMFRALLSLGAAYHIKSDPLKAIAAWQRALDVKLQVREYNEPEDPLYRPLCRGLATVAKTAGKHEQAARALRELISTQPAQFGRVQIDWTVFDELAEVHRLERAALRDRSDEKSRQSVFVRQRRELEPLVQRPSGGFGGSSSVDYQANSRVQEQLLNSAVELLGEKHWRTVDARLARERSLILASLKRPQLASVEEFAQEEPAIERNFADGLTANALALAEKHRLLRAEVFGERHPDYASSLSLLGMLHRALGEGRQAEAHLQQAWQTRSEALGKFHPQTAIVAGQLSQLYYDTGRNELALKCLRQALDGLEGGFGQSHPAYQATLNNLAVLCQATGNHVEASELLDRGYEAFLLTRDEPFAERAGPSMESYALNSGISGESNWSGSLQLQVAFAPSPIDTFRSQQAQWLNNLARAKMATGDWNAAIVRLKEARSLHDALLSSDDEETRKYVYRRTDHSTCLNNLGLCYVLSGKLELASLVLDESLKLRLPEADKPGSAYAVGLNSLAALRVAQKDQVAAEKLLRESIEIQVAAGNEAASGCVSARGNLALVVAAQGRHDESLALLKQLTSQLRQQLVATSAVQSEREQLAQHQAQHGYLDALLSIGLEAKHPPRDLYVHALAWKGSIFARQRRIRERQRLAATQQSEALRVLNQLDAVSRELVREVRQQTEFSLLQRAETLANLNQRREALERELAALSPDVRSHEQMEQLDPAKLQAVLPAGSVLLDFVEIAPPALPPGKRPERRLAVFVIPHNGELHVIDLGPVRPIAAAIAKFHETLGRRAGPGAGPGKELRQQIWEKIEPSLGDAKQIFVSADGVVGELPFAALPGVDPGSFLVESLTFVSIPFPQELMRGPVVDLQGNSADGASLLVLGDIDYGVPVMPEIETESRNAIWKPLPGTRGEMLSVRDSFEQRHPFPDGQVHALRSSRATEAAFREHAPSYRFLHVATHGFFASARSAAAVVDGESEVPLDDAPTPSALHPGWQCGLVLAGANQPADLSGDDGVLSALEIAEIDLTGVELAVLSACETGIGESAQGEGLIGLQRAFQVAGTRSVVASLWKVDDTATREMMERFYDNLWTRQFSRAESLRQAQLWMLNERGSRGLEAAEGPSGDDQRRLPPYFWAAFVLSGEWR